MTASIHSTKFSNQSGEGDIHRALMKADLMDCMVALPGQLLYSTENPAWLWFTAKKNAAANQKFGSRRGIRLVSFRKPSGRFAVNITNSI